MGFPSQPYKPSAKMPKKVVISIDNSVVSRDALTWASKSLVRWGSVFWADHPRSLGPCVRQPSTRRSSLVLFCRPEDELHVITVLEPVMRSDFSSSAESGLAYEGSEGVRFCCHGCIACHSHVPHS